MRVTITDDQKTYAADSSSHKLLIGNAIIFECSFLNTESLLQFNAQLNGIENLAAEKMIEELKLLASELKNVNPNKFLKTRNNQYDINYSLLYPNFSIIVLNRNILELLLSEFLKLNNLTKNDKFVFILSDKFSLIKETELIKQLGSSCEFLFSKDQANKFSYWKNAYYFAHSLKKRILSLITCKSKKKHFVLYLYDTRHYLDLFPKFFELINQSDNLQLTIVQLECGSPKDNVSDASKYKSNNIHYYKFQDFRNPVFENNTSFFRQLNKFSYGAIFKKSNLNKNSEIYYSFVNLSFRFLKPDIVLYVNTGNAGRTISDVSRYYKIPSVNIEYGLFTDDAIHMECNIKFTARACLGESSINLWKKRHDPTLIHWPIGYLKFDNIKKQFDIESIKKTLSINNSNKTLMFASTWGGTNDLYNIEKVVICKFLEELSIKNDWNFLVKKHPAETDNLIKHNLKSNHAKIIEHSEISLEELIYVSDLIINQASGVVLEVMFYGKPIMYLNLNENYNLSQLSLIKNEPFVLHANKLENIETTLLQLMGQNNVNLYEGGVNYYFVNDDKYVSQRLIDNCNNLIQNKIY